MTKILGLLIKYWYLIAILVLTASLAFTGNLLKNSYKRNGELAFQVEVQKKAKKIVADQLAACNKRIDSNADEARDDYQACLDVAKNTDSSSFKKGVEVGKIIGAKQCQDSYTKAIQRSAQPVQPLWPRLSQPPPVRQ